MFHYKVKNKYIWLTLLILVILALCFNMILSYILKTNLENEALSSLSKDTIIISEEINTYLSEGHTIISQMLTNEDFIDYIITTDESKNKRKYYRYDEVTVMLNRILKSNSKLLNVWLGVEEINDILTEDMRHRKEQIVEFIENVSASYEETSASMEEMSASTEEQLAVMENLANEAQQLSNLANSLYEILEKFQL